MYCLFVKFWCKKMRESPISERPFPIDLNGIKRNLSEAIDTCTAYFTTDMN